MPLFVRRQPRPLIRVAPLPFHHTIPHIVRRRPDVREKPVVVLSIDLEAGADVAKSALWIPGCERRLRTPAIERAGSHRFAATRLGLARWKSPYVEV
jgi:hypothetical protein